jgi:phage regulator Rha-like protein
MSDLIPQEHIEGKIYLIRGLKVMLDRDLAELYGVETKHLKRQVRRNVDRFPLEFMFELSDEEFQEWRRQFGASNFRDKMGLRYRPYAFTEQGVAMLSSVLNSKRAIQVNIIIIKTFMKLREIISLHKDLAQKLSQLERKYERHDEQIHAIFDQIREFMTFKEKPKKQIGF